MTLTTQLSVDLHGYHPDQVCGFPLEALIKQAFEMGVDRLRLVHGHGRHRPGGIRAAVFNTCYLGIRIRNELKHPSSAMRRCMGSTIIDKQHAGQTIISIKKNPSPTRDESDLTVLPETRERRRYEADWAWGQHLRGAVA
jgi:hypothetical protein